jgi:hypothetical protein
MKSNIHDVEVILHAQTDRAVLVSLNKYSNRHWVPLSQCEIEKKEGNVAVLTAEEWLLTEKELI